MVHHTKRTAPSEATKTTYRLHPKTIHKLKEANKARQLNCVACIVDKMYQHTVCMRHWTSTPFCEQEDIYQQDKYGDWMKCPACVCHKHTSAEMHSCIPVCCSEPTQHLRSRCDCLHGVSGLSDEEEECRFSTLLDSSASLCPASEKLESHKQFIENKIKESLSIPDMTRTEFIEFREQLMGIAMGSSVEQPIRELIQAFVVSKTK